MNTSGYSRLGAGTKVTPDTASDLELGSTPTTPKRPTSATSVSAPPKTGGGRGQAVEQSQLVRGKSAKELLGREKFKSLTSPLVLPADTKNKDKSIEDDIEIIRFKRQRTRFLELFNIKDVEQKIQLSDMKNCHDWPSNDREAVFKLVNDIKTISLTTYETANRSRYYIHIINFLLEINKIPKNTATRSRYLSTHFILEARRIVPEGEVNNLSDKITDVENLASKLEVLDRYKGSPEEPKEALLAAGDLLCSTPGCQPIFDFLSASQLVGLGSARINSLVGFMKAKEDSLEKANDQLSNILKGFEEAGISYDSCLKPIYQKMLKTIEVMCGRVGLGTTAEEKAESKSTKSSVKNEVKVHADIKEGLAKKLLDFELHPQVHILAIASIYETFQTLTCLETLKSSLEGFEARVKTMQLAPTNMDSLLAVAARGVLDQCLVDVRTLIANNNFDCDKLYEIGNIAVLTHNAVVKPSADSFREVYEHSAEYEAQSDNLSRPHISSGLKNAFAVFAITLLTLSAIAFAPITAGASLKLGLMIAATAVGVLGIAALGWSARQADNAKKVEWQAKNTGVHMSLALFGPKSQLHQSIFKINGDVLGSPRTPVRKKT